ncbi:prion-like-(Q/N-rich) domain-bearing protein 25 [Microplitis demolitor]|uniref:prion-like-(Q/N-rich) domain-bearing protein 25 n=1 Tax=Microplitis demolitor TaxID=69319 RepID=UPI0006D515D8|nr:prion-like-(Q/N-rich) domain-bearing protein 25 [Microplitis demolitor]
MMITFLLLIFTLTEANIFKLLNETIEEKVPIYECANYGNRCNRFLRKPCCEKDNICRRMGWGAFNDLYMCVKLSKLNEDCQYNLDCLQVDYTECYDHKCKCLPNYIAAGTTACLPLLGRFCKNDRQCIADNSVCIDHKCQCQPSFVPESDHKCVPTPLGKNCMTDFDCDLVEFSKCSADYKCVCKKNYVVSNNSTCVGLLGEFCKKDNDCGTHNSICTDSVCQCKNNYISKSNHECVPTPLGKSCINNDDCADLFHTKCSKDKICVCRGKYVEVNGIACSPLLGEYCWQNELCAANNSICADNECQCKKNYVPISNNECRESSIGQPCNGNSDCNSIQRPTKCSLDNKCVCESDFLASDGVTCLQALGDYCFYDNQCGPRLSACKCNVCQCNFYFKAESYNKCSIH